MTGSSSTVELATAKFVLTHVDDEGTPVVINDGAIAHAAGSIIATGPLSVLRQEYPGAEVLGSDSDILFPGLVDSHHHVGLTPVQLGVPDLPLELWIAARMTSRAVNLYLDTLYSAFELISCGVTTVQHLRNTFPIDGEDLLTTSHEVLRAYLDVGMRASYSVNIRDQHVLGYFEDDDLLRRLPDDSRSSVARALREARVSASDGIELVSELRSHYESSDRLRFQLMPANLHWCSDEALETLAEFSSTNGVPIHLHLAETVYQAEYAYRRANRSGVEHIASLGLTSPRLTLGHAVWISEDEASILADSGASICMNCSSNLRLSSGIAPLRQWLSRGINVALGMDEAGINDDRDMFQEMRLALYLHQSPGLYAGTGPSSGDILRMATQGGARTTPFGDSIGALTPGASADFVLADAHHMMYPGIAEHLGVGDLLVRRLRSSDVHTVVVGGEAIYANQEFVNVDRREVLREIEDQLARPPSAGDLAGREMGLELLQHIRPLYADYLSEDRQERLLAARNRR